MTELDHRASHRANLKTSARRTLVLLTCSGVFVLGTGCRLCCDLEDQAFSAYGGKWQRTNRDSGRVGSLYEPAGGVTPELQSREVEPLQEGSRLAPPDSWQEQEYPDDLKLPEPPPGSENSQDNELQTNLGNEAAFETAIVPGAPLPPASF